MKAFVIWLKKHTLALACVCVAILLLLAFLCLELMFERTLGTVNEQNASISSVRSGQIRTELDAMLRSVTDMVTLIASNPAVTQFSSVGAPENAAEHYRLYQLLSSFSSTRNLLSGNSLLQDFAVYYPAGDVLVTSSAYHRTRHFYDVFYAGSGPEYDLWLQILSSQVSGGFVPAACTDDVLMYMQSLSLASMPSANAILFLNRRQVRRHIAELEGDDNRVFVWADSLLLGSGRADEALAAQVRGCAAGAETPASVVCLSSALYKNLSYYIVSLPEAEASPLKLSLRQFYSTSLVVAFIIMLVLVGLILSWLLPRTARIAARLRTSRPEKPLRSMALVRKALEQALSRDASHEAASQWPMLKDALLDKLTRDGGGHDDLLRSLSLYNIRFIHPCFQVAVLRLHGGVGAAELDALSGLFDGRGDLFPGPGAAGVCFPLGHGTLAALFNLPDGCADGAARAERMRLALREKRGAPVTALVGSVQRGFDGIRPSYDDAMSCADYAIFTGDDATIDFASLGPEDTQYFYPIDVELKLISAAKTGAYDHVTELLEQIRRENFENRRLRPDIARLLLSELTGTALKALDDRNDDLPADAILKCHTVADVFDALGQLYLSACESARRTEPDTERKRAFAEYILGHYTDPNFSQSGMASDLNLSPNYLSAQFKAYFQTTMITYVTSLRVARAAELLSATDATVSEIAAMVGFGGTDALNRAFKKEYGVTAGSYRSGTGRA